MDDPARQAHELIKLSRFLLTQRRDLTFASTLEFRVLASTSRDAVGKSRELLARVDRQIRAARGKEP